MNISNKAEKRTKCDKKKVMNFRTKINRNGYFSLSLKF